MLVVLHQNGNGHEATLDQDVKHMAARYGSVVHVMQDDNLTFDTPSPTPGDDSIHILAHGRSEGVADISRDTFKKWIVRAFKLTAAPTKTQKFFIYSCDIARGATNMLNEVARYVAGQQIQNRTFIGTVAENGVINSGSGVGKILVKERDGNVRPLGQGWKAYRTVMVGRQVRAYKLKDPDVSALVKGVMHW